MLPILILIVCSLLSSSDGNGITDLINKERTKYSLMKPVEYNYEIHDFLEFFTRNQQGYLYTNGTKKQDVVLTCGSKNTTRTKHYRGDFLMQEEYYFNKYNSTWYHLFHDTTNTDIEHIIKYRIRQKNCFNFNRCSNTTFNNYFSCLKNCNAVAFTDSQRCSWAWWYYPMILQRSLSEIACVTLNYRGPHTPSNQTRSFWCYGRFDNLKLTDNPFLN